jgi:hypothetical protein
VHQIQAAIAFSEINNSNKLNVVNFLLDFVPDRQLVHLYGSIRFMMVLDRNNTNTIDVDLFNTTDVFASKIARRQRSTFEKVNEMISALSPVERFAAIRTIKDITKPEILLTAKACSEFLTSNAIGLSSNRRTLDEYGQAFMQLMNKKTDAFHTAVEKMRRQLNDYTKLGIVKAANVIMKNVADGKEQKASDLDDLLTDPRDESFSTLESELGLIRNSLKVALSKLTIEQQKATTAVANAKKSESKNPAAEDLATKRTIQGPTDLFMLFEAKPYDLLFGKFFSMLAGAINVDVGAVMSVEYNQVYKAYLQQLKKNKNRSEPAVASSSSSLLSSMLLASSSSDTAEADELPVSKQSLKLIETMVNMDVYSPMKVYNDIFAVALRPAVYYSASQIAALCCRYVEGKNLKYTSDGTLVSFHYIWINDRDIRAAFSTCFGDFYNTAYPTSYNGTRKNEDVRQGMLFLTSQLDRWLNERLAKNKMR